MRTAFDDLPWSMTKIWSQSATVLRRWLTRMIVRWRFQARQCLGDHLFVLRIERAGGLIQHDDRRLRSPAHGRCRSAGAGRRTGCCRIRVIWVSYFCGSFSMKALAPASSAARCICASVASGRPYAMFSATVVGRITLSCSTSADVLPQDPPP